MAAVIALVALRLCLGFHFFYEGVWKIKNSDKFSAEPFLAMAKGPLKPVFDAMITDVEGHERLAIEVKASAEPLLARWWTVYDLGLADIRETMDVKRKKSVVNSQDAVRKFNIIVLPILWQAEDQLTTAVAENESKLLELLDPTAKKPAGDLEASRAKLAASLGATIARIESNMIAAITAKNTEDATPSSMIRRALGIMFDKFSPSITVTETAAVEGEDVSEGEDAEPTTPLYDTALTAGVLTGTDYHYIQSIDKVINARGEADQLGLPIYDEDGKSVKAVGGKLTGTDGQTLVVVGHVCPGAIHADMIDRIWKDAYAKFRLGDSSLYEVAVVVPEPTEGQTEEEAAQAKQAAVEKANAKSVELALIQRVEAERLTRRYQAEIAGYLAENLVDIQRYFGSLKRHYEAVDRGDNGADHQKQRDWDRLGELRGEAKGWTRALNGAVDNYARTFYEVILTEKQQQMGEMHSDFTWNDFLTVMLKYSLAAIGFCLIIGAFSRPAALGGAAFMCFVIMSQPNWPGLYPPSPAVTGHALLINKDFIEMVALLVIAAVGAGRWGGLDALIEPCCMKMTRFCPRR